MFITGHTGFKGAWLTTLLHTLDSKICGYSLDPPSEPSLFEVLKLSTKIEKSIHGNINDPEAIKKELSLFQPDLVFHLAAQSLVRHSYKDPMDTFQTNILGTANLLQAIRDTPSVKSCLVITTDKCYENLDRGTAFQETDPLGGRDPYSSSKACAEIVVHSMRSSFFDEKKIRISTARAGNVIGGGDWAKDRIITDLVNAIDSHQPVLLRHPEATRPWQHVLEPITAYLKIAELNFENKLDGQAFNIGPDLSSEKSVEFVVDHFYRACGLTPRIEKDLSTKPHEAKLLMLDNQKAKALLNWSPQYSTEQAIKVTADWYQNFSQKKIDAWTFTISQINCYLNAK